MNPGQISLVELVSTFLKYLKEKKIAISILFLLSISSSLIYYSRLDLLYVSHMRVISNETSFPITESLLEPIYSAIRIENRKVLASSLNMDETALKSFKSLNVKEIKSNVPYEKLDHAIIEIEVVGTNPEEFDNLKKSLLIYLNHNIYVKSIIERKSMEFNEIVTEAETQLLNLDSIQHIILKDALNSGKPDLGNLDLGLLYMQKMEIKVIQEEKRTLLDQIDEFKLLSGFINIERTKGPIYWTAIGLLIGLILNSILGSFYLWKYIRDYN